MMGKNNRTKKDFKYNSKLYEKLKIRVSESRKGRPGYWSGKKRNEEFKQKLSKKFKGRKYPRSRSSFCLNYIQELIYRKQLNKKSLMRIKVRVYQLNIDRNCLLNSKAEK